MNSLFREFVRAFASDEVVHYTHGDTPRAQQAGRKKSGRRGVGQGKAGGEGGGCQTLVSHSVASLHRRRKRKQEVRLAAVKHNAGPCTGTNKAVCAVPTAEDARAHGRVDRLSCTLPLLCVSCIHRAGGGGAMPNKKRKQQNEPRKTSRKKTLER